MTLFLVLLMALTSVAQAGMGDTTSMAIISARVISMEADSMAVDSTEAAGTAVAATGRAGRRNDRQQLEPDGPLK